MTKFTHARAVLEAQRLVTQFQTAYPDEPHIVAGRLARLTPTIDQAMIDHPSAEKVFNLCVVELARSLNRVAKDGVPVPAADANTTYLKAHRSLVSSGLAAAGGFALSQSLAIAHDYPELFAPNLALAARVRPAQKHGDVTFELR